MAAPELPPLVDPGYVAGVDLGGTKVRAALADLTGRILVEEAVGTDPRGGAAVTAQIATLVRELAHAAGVAWSDVRTTAVGIPGAHNPTTGAVELAPNVAGFADVDVHDDLVRRLGHAVVLDNDVNMAAFGEQWVGGGRNHRDFVFVAVGTGIGMGIVADGQLIRGATGAAGEICYLPIGTDPFDPANQARGALEEAVAGASLAARYAAASGEETTVPDVFDRAAAGDARARAALDDEARYIALAVVSVAAVLDPEAVVLGGGIGSRAELLEPVRRWVAALRTGGPIVKTSQLGHRAGLIGAVAAARRAAISTGRPRALAHRHGDRISSLNQRRDHR
ncbi:Sugar kinase of the NBD/HSP70 family, may contain an N-terminal HTH domain [Micromonospora pattaloongensis]|uniref:Sugar kinase of the NBD/HSP70 family, may contain an N-terminal HTH domain n=1 Tax=Micromonospora pattaloongensis TaxID=405436 RepID=A0A1H3PFV5_9ACTN|nr:ROK family protein [Micromonospora pattaloongensis]SDY99961.1 Sugar kinase of the NBD/HSP70 family, may contain an N-terminal HTH domain [Micromonospora pattaloongensis]